MILVALRFRPADCASKSAKEIYVRASDGDAPDTAYCPACGVAVVKHEVGGPMPGATYWEHPGKFCAGRGRGIDTIRLAREELQKAWADFEGWQYQGTDEGLGMFAFDRLDRLENAIKRMLEV